MVVKQVMVKAYVRVDLKFDLFLLSEHIYGTVFIAQYNAADKKGQSADTDMKKTLKTLSLTLCSSLLALLGCQTNSEHPVSAQSAQPTQPTSSNSPSLTQMEQSVYSYDIHTISAYVKKSTSEQERQLFKNKLRGVISTLADKHISMSIYNQRPYHVSDVVLFNDKKDKVLMLTTWLRSDKDTKKGKYKPAGFCDLFAGNKQADSTWVFQHRGLPGYSYGYSEKHRNGIFFTSKELVYRSLQKEVLDNQLVKRGKLNQDYFNNHMWRF